MIWPTLIVDNFFDDPHKVINFSKQLKYERAPGHEWPGTRTDHLGKVGKEFFLWSTRKIMMLLFPMNIEQINWKAVQHFQKIPYKTFGKSGWVHLDDKDEFTVIIYLSNHPKSGTGLYKAKQFTSRPLYGDKKTKFFKDLKNYSSTETWRKKANAHFEKVVDLRSNFNRLVLFDGHQWHGAENYGTEKEDRLTLITFFKDVRGTGVPIRYPIPMMRRQ